MVDRKLLCVPRTEAERLLDMSTAIRLVEEDFVRTTKGNALFPGGRIMQIDLPTVTGRHFFFSKMCGLREEGVVGFRCAGVVPENQHRGYILLLEAASALPCALIDETWSWELRTGAEAGVAAKYLARRGAKHVGMLGCGLMAHPVLRALGEVLEIAEVRVTSRRAQTREAFARRMEEELGLALRPVATVEEILEAADVIVTLTTANAPLVAARSLRAGSLVLSMGTYQELDPEVFRRVHKVIPDDWEKCKVWGDLAQALRAGTLAEDGIYAELGDVVAGRRPGRERDDEIILAVPQGMISQDVALAHFIYQQARANGLGRWIDL